MTKGSSKSWTSVTLQGVAVSKTLRTTGIDHTRSTRIKQRIKLCECVIYKYIPLTSSVDRSV